MRFKTFQLKCEIFATLYRTAFTIRCLTNIRTRYTRNGLLFLHISLNLLAGAGRVPAEGLAGQHDAAAGVLRGRARRARGKGRRRGEGTRRDQGRTLGYDTLHFYYQSVTTTI